MKKRKKLQVLYCQVMKRSSYLGVGKPDLNGSWMGASAADMVTKSKGNCYSYASLIGLLAKAVGYDAKVYIGKCNRNTSEATEHSWVVIDKKYILDGVFEDLNYQDDGSLKFFFRTYAQLKDDVGYVYYPDSVAK